MTMFSTTVVQIGICEHHYSIWVDIRKIRTSKSVKRLSVSGSRLKLCGTQNSANIYGPLMYVSHTRTHIFRSISRSEESQGLQCPACAAFGLADEISKRNLVSQDLGLKYELTTSLIQRLISPNLVLEISGINQIRTKCGLGHEFLVLMVAMFLLIDTRGSEDIHVSQITAKKHIRLSDGWLYGPSPPHSDLWGILTPY